MLITNILQNKKVIRGSFGILGIDDHAILLVLRLIYKKAKSMATLSFNEVEEAIDGDDDRLLMARQSDETAHIIELCFFQASMNVNKSS